MPTKGRGACGFLAIKVVVTLDFKEIILYNNLKDM